MIYKIQRLFSDGGGKKKKGTPDKPQYEAPTANIETYNNFGADTKKGREAVEKQRYEELKLLNGNASVRDPKTGERITEQSSRAKYETKLKNIDELEKYQKKMKRQEKIDKAKQKVKNATDKTKAWTKKNKKGLIIGGSVLAAGTGAAVVGSKINKKNKENKIKKDVRGY